MSQSCVFYFREYWSPSDYVEEIETDGSKVHARCPLSYAEGSSRCDSFCCIEVRPGQHIFRYSITAEGTSARLIVVPEGPRFQEFVEKSRLASQAVYERILGYRSARTGPYDYKEDFAGGWLEEFTTHSWGDTNLEVEDFSRDGLEEAKPLECPTDLKSALSLLSFEPPSSS